MKHILLPGDAGLAVGDGDCRASYDLRVYLALEEWVARNLPADDYFFTWIVPPTVIIGRNQDLRAEVDIEYCRANGIDIVRRRSGGGCVYADYNNIMISFVTASADDVATTFARYTGRVAGQLCRMGLDATATGRNDITVGGRKISGNAFYHLPGRSIVHGTMLFDTDATHMSRAITPSRSKLESKRVRSVASHIVTAHSLLPDMTIAEFNRRLVQGMSDATLRLDDAQMAEVEAIADNYRRPEWLSGYRRCDGGRAYRNSGRIDGVGEFAVSVNLDQTGHIDTVDMTGDFFMLADLDESLLRHLRGAMPTQDAILGRIADIDVGRVIANMDREAVAALVAEPQCNK